MVTNIEVWTIGRMAAEQNLEVEFALERYANHLDGDRQITREQNEIFRDGYAGVNRDFAEDLDRAAAK